MSSISETIIDRLSVEISGDSRAYNTSIDAAIAKTKAMQTQQRKLVDDLDKNRLAQEKTAQSIKNYTASLEKNNVAIAEVSRKHGEQSAQVEKLIVKRTTLSRAIEDNIQKLERQKNSENGLASQLRSINKELEGKKRSLEDVADATGRLETKTSGLTKMITALASGYTAKKIFEATIGSLAGFEQYETSFAVMLGSLGSAKVLMKELEDFAAVTPFQLPQVTQVGELLLNYGVAAEDLINTMGMLGDISKGQADKYDRIALAYGQMLAKGKVTGEELRQMTEAGVPLTQALADSMGIATSELMGFIEKGEVGIPELNKAIEDLTTGTGKFANMMEKQSQTMIGLWSTTKDEMGKIGREIGEEAFDVTKDSLKELMAEIKDMRESGELEQITAGWGKSLSLLTKIITGVTVATVKNKEVFGALVTAFGAFHVLQQGVVAWKAYHVAVEGSKKAMMAMSAVTSVNPYIALAGAIMFVAGAAITLANGANSAAKEVEKLNKTMDDAKDRANNILTEGNDQIVLLEHQAQRYETLRRQVETTGEGYGELKDVATELQKMLPNAIDMINAETGAYLNLETAIANVITQKRIDDALTANKEVYDQAVLNKPEAQKLVEKTLDEYAQRYNEGNIALEKSLDPNVLGGGNAFLQDAKSRFTEADELKTVYEEALKSLEDIDSIIKEYQDYTKQYEPPTSGNGDGGGGGSGGNGAPSEGELIKQFYKDQLEIIKDYLEEKKELLKEDYNYQKDAITKGFDFKLDILKREYEAERDKINKVIDEINREIASKKKAREEEKLEQDLTLKTKQISVLEQQIAFARSPEEKAELEKELKKQQEQLKDLQLKEEVNKLEREKKQHQDKLVDLKDTYEQEKEYLQEQKELKLENLEETHQKALANIEESAITLQNNLNSTFGYIDDKTMSIGQRFANVTTNALGSGFDTLVTRSQTAIDDMMVQVQNALNSLDSRMNRIVSRGIEANRERERYSNNYSSSDNRRMNVTNHIVQGLTASQVDGIMSRQADRFLYGR